VLAFTFPGQGSQRPGMGQAWIDHPSWELVDDASEATGRDLEHLLLRAEAAELTETRNAQLATFTLSLVVLDAVERLGINPAMCAGHSLGEYTALVAAGAISFDDGARVVAERGEAMQAAAEDAPGTMSAVLGIDDDAAEHACRRADGDAWVANFNAPGQVVIAGSADCVARAGAVAKELGAKKVMPLPVGGAFHTPYMAPARNRLRKALVEATFCDPDVPVFANVDARPYRHAGDWPSLLSAQLCSPVRWRQSLSQMTADGASVFVELGAGGVLSGLVRRTLPQATGVGVATPADLDKLVDTLAGDTPLHAYVTKHEGESLFMSERLVVSPAAGLFEPANDVKERIDVGALLGRVGDVEVRSPFEGAVMGMLAFDGERVQVGQPIAWLRSA
jgi:[acyl-carrier-protein] S-malonyltransferase